MASKAVQKPSGVKSVRFKEDSLHSSLDFELRVISWNINGQDGRDLQERTMAAIDIIKHHSPHIVFLQEVVPQTLGMLHSGLESTYSVHISAQIKFQYYLVILVTKACPNKISIESEVGWFDFPGSSMGRYLVQLFIKVCGISMALYTTHLESLKSNSKERTEQLKMCFKFISKQKDRVCIFGGDLNLRDHELAKVEMPEATVDIWEACGSVKDLAFTWDMFTNDNRHWSSSSSNKPRLRFDRLYLTQNNCKKVLVRPVSFELIGMERVPSCRMRFPSDHWGIYTVIEIKPKPIDVKEKEDIKCDCHDCHSNIAMKALKC